MFGLEAAAEVAHRYSKYTNDLPSLATGVVDVTTNCTNTIWLSRYKPPAWKVGWGPPKNDLMIQFKICTVMILKGIGRKWMGRKCREFICISTEVENELWCGAWMERSQEKIALCNKDIDATRAQAHSPVLCSIQIEVCLLELCRLLKFIHRYWNRLPFRMPPPRMDLFNRSRGIRKCRRWTEWNNRQWPSCNRWCVQNEYACTHVRLQVVRST